MDYNTIVNLITAVGFPIVCCLVMGWFIFKIYQNYTKEHRDLLLSVQTESEKREEKLTKQLEKSQEINAQAIATIAQYADRLDNIQRDVNEIKEDIIVISEKIS